MISAPLQLLMSSNPAVIRPFPSAVKLPIRANGLALTVPPLPQSSVPLIENAYFPLKVAFENLAGGGGGVPPPPPDDDPPPHAAEKTPIATEAVTARANRRRERRFLVRAD